jgi:hypothetical protein
LYGEQGYSSKSINDTKYQLSYCVPSILTGTNLYNTNYSDSTEIFSQSLKIDNAYGVIRVRISGDKIKEYMEKSYEYISFRTTDRNSGASGLFLLDTIPII